MCSIAVGVVLFCAGCGSSSETKTAAPADPANVVPTKAVIQMNDPDLRAYVVNDVTQNCGASWCWGADKPELRLKLSTKEGVKAVVDFSIAKSTFDTTGPMAVKVSVNSHPLGEMRITKPDSYHFEKPVPAEWIDTSKLTDIMIATSKVWISPADQQHLSLILSRAGFVTTP